MGRIVLDTSAVIAILNAEPLARELEQRIRAADAREISSCGVVEAASVLIGQQPAAASEAIGLLQTLIRRLDIAVAPFDAEQAQIAVEARLKFGKGRHAARLNLGDCFSYALARMRKAPLLYVGDDFARTDIEAALV